MASRPTRYRLKMHRVTRLCPTEKWCFRTRDHALDAAERQMMKGQVMPGCHITPFQCDACGYWHLGNKVIVPLGPNQRRWLP